MGLFRELLGGIIEFVFDVTSDTVLRNADRYERKCAELGLEEELETIARGKAVFNDPNTYDKVDDFIDMVKGRR